MSDRDLASDLTVVKVLLCNRSPDVLICNDEGLAQRLCSVEPDPRVLLYGSRKLPGDGSGAGVERARDRRQESLVCAAWADA